MIFDNGRVKVRLEFFDGLIFSHYGIYDKFLPSDYKYLRSLLEKCSYELGAISAPVDTGDDKTIRLIKKLGYIETNLQVLYSDGFYRRVYRYG